MVSRAAAAARFQRDLVRRSDGVVNRALRLWGTVPVSDLDAGWELVWPDLGRAVSSVVAQNAASGQRMVSEVGRLDGVAGDVLVPNAFLGVDRSGRSAAGLLHGSVTTTKQYIGAGYAPRVALTAGAAYLAAMTKTLVSDMARSSAMVASAGRGYVRYVRVVSAGACSRCAILAGSDRFSYHFERHPGCLCTSVPVRDDGDLDGLIASPEEHFASLTEAEQDRIYTKAGAEAIRLGADPVQVVGARRGASGMAYSRANPPPPGQIRRMQRVQIGMRPDGSPILGYTTIEGTSKQGFYGRASYGRARLMPETIIGLTDDTAMRRTLLRDAGYLTSSGGLYQQQLDRVAADTFYRSKGIDLY